MDGKARMAQKTIVRSEYEYRGARWAETSGGDRGLACQDERMGAWFFRHAFGEGGDGEKLDAPPARFLSPATTDAQRRRVLERFKQLTIACTWEEPESSFRLSFARNRFGAHCVGYLGLRRKVESADPDFSMVGSEARAFARELVEEELWRLSGVYSPAQASAGDCGSWLLMATDGVRCFLAQGEDAWPRELEGLCRSLERHGFPWLMNPFGELGAPTSEPF